MDVKARGFVGYMRTDEALDHFLKESQVERLGAEEVPLLDGLGRILYEDIYTMVDVPSFDRAAVDGFALKAENTYGASPSNPVVFDVEGVVEVGQLPTTRVSDFKAVKIFTGAPLPEGSDSVVMLEYTNQIASAKIEVVQSVTPWKNVSKQGEDLKKGDKVLISGLLLRAQDIGILASIGNSRVKVSKRPRVAVLSTGNELMEPAAVLPFGKIVDSNQYTIVSAVKEAGGEAIILGVARDDPGEIQSKIERGLEEADLVLTIGGTSVGQKDLVPEVVKSLGKPGIIVHGVSMRPGAPTALAIVKEKPVILLPGNPVAAFIAFFVFVKRIMARMQGIPDNVKNFMITARLARRVPSTVGMKSYVRVSVRELDGEYVAEPIKIAGAGVLSSIVKANGLLVIPEDREGFERGEKVEIIVLRDTIW
jgi:molybdopterin molybdotransferase